MPRRPPRSCSTSATYILLYGHQPQRFFPDYYDSYCYLPLYIFASDQLLCAWLSRPTGTRRQGRSKK